MNKKIAKALVTLSALSITAGSIAQANSLESSAKSVTATIQKFVQDPIKNKEASASVVVFYLAASVAIAHAMDESAATGVAAAVSVSPAAVVGSLASVKMTQKYEQMKAEGKKTALSLLEERESTGNEPVALVESFALAKENNAIAANTTYQQFVEDLASKLN